MQKKILYIDMDGVIADFDKGIKRLSPGQDTHNFVASADKVDAICAANPLIFHDLEIIKGAKAAIEILFHHFEVYFLSTPMWHVPESFTGKRLWLHKHFGEMAVKRLILTHRKDLNIGHFLVDDRKMHGVENFRGEHIHYGSEQFPSWGYVVNYLLNHQ